MFLLLSTTVLVPNVENKAFWIILNMGHMLTFSGNRPHSNYVYFWCICFRVFWVVLWHAPHRYVFLHLPETDRWYLVFVRLRVCALSYWWRTMHQPPANECIWRYFDMPLDIESCMIHIQPVISTTQFIHSFAMCFTSKPTIYIYYKHVYLNGFWGHPVACCI